MSHTPKMGRPQKQPTEPIVRATYFLSLHGELKPTDVCDLLRISRKTFYNYIRIYDAYLRLHQRIDEELKNTDLTPELRELLNHARAPKFLL